MCISLATSATLASGSAAVATIGKIDKYCRQCIQPADAAGGVAETEARAAQGANATIAARRRAMRSGSLLTGGGDNAAAGMASAQRQTLGGT